VGEETRADDQHALVAEWTQPPSQLEQPTGFSVGIEICSTGMSASG
jgi:hypothetical protein